MVSPLVPPSTPATASEVRTVEIAVPVPILERVEKLARHLGEDLESVLYYEHPLSVRGAVVVVSESAASYPELLAWVYGMLSQVRLHCFRPRELFQLALPGFSAPPALDDQPHLAQCVKYRSVLLHGRDFRPEVPLPARLDLFLPAHLRGCRHYMRVHYLKRLLAREHRQLIGELVEEMRRLLSIALLEDGGWQVDLANVAERFAAVRLGEASRVARQLETLGDRLRASPETDLQAEAREACWLFERLLDLLNKELP